MPAAVLEFIRLYGGIIMYFVIAMVLGLVCSALRPLSDGLFDTSMWVAKVLLPPDSEDNDTTRQYLKVHQSALMEGWLSNVPLITGMLGFGAIISGFVYRWWGAFVIYLVIGIFSGVAKQVFTRSVSHYLVFLLQKMVNRATDYRIRSDFERAEAAESYCGDVANLMAIYQESSVKPPTAAQLKRVPYGDLYYWFEHGKAAV